MDTLIMAVSSPLMRNAFAVCVLVSLCAALIGVVLVLKRFSFLGDGLSHFSFGVVALAAVLNIASNMSMPFVMLGTAVCAVFLLRVGEKARVKGDAAVAVLSVSSLAVGYLLIRLFRPSASITEHTLFGSTEILTLGKEDVLLCAVLATVLIVLFVLFYNRVFAVTFDESFAAASGIRVNVIHTLIAVFAAIVIVMAMKLVGSLLISALVVFPALSAMRLCRSFGAVTVASGIIAVIGSSVGMILSILFPLPVGATIVVTDLVLYGISCFVGRVKG